MARRDWSLLLGAAAVLYLSPARAEAPAAEAEVKAEEKTFLQQVTQRLRPQVSMYYARALAPADYSDFSHSFGLNFNLGVMIQPTLVARAGISVDRELGVPIENWRASNTSLSLTKMFNFEKWGWVMPMVYGALPTNDEAREYLSYRGSLGAAVSWVNDGIFTFRGKDHALGAGLSLQAGRNFYQYTTSIEGALTNNLSVIGLRAQLFYTLFQRVSFLASFRNLYQWNANGRTDDAYELGASVQYMAPYGIRLTLSAETADRTFLPDQVTPNIRLYKPENTLVMFSVGYAPSFETITQ